MRERLISIGRIDAKRLTMCDADVFIVLLRMKGFQSTFYRYGEMWFNGPYTVYINDDAYTTPGYPYKIEIKWNMGQKPVLGGFREQPAPYLLRTSDYQEAAEYICENF
jgi:hypothetical protein